VEYRYSKDFSPPAPVIEISVSVPLSKDSTSLTALIDSGADITVIPERIISQLNMRRVDSALASGFGRGVTEATVYAAILSIEGVLKPRIYRVLGWRENYTLLGRDLLNQLMTVLDGPNGKLKLR
jgi:predicted aspartyl protease